MFLSGLIISVTNWEIYMQLSRNVMPLVIAVTSTSLNLNIHIQR